MSAPAPSMRLDPSTHPHPHPLPLCPLPHLPPNPPPLIPLPHGPPNLRIPPLRHVHMALTPVPQRRLAQMPPPALLKRKLHPIPPLRSLQRPHMRRYIHALKRRIVAHALEERDAEARALAPRGAEDAVGGARADAVRERFEALADGHDEGAGDGGAVDPFAGDVLGLEAAVGGCLQEVGGEHAVLVGSDALSAGGFLLFTQTKLRHVGIFHDLQFVLLVLVEEAVEGGRGQADGFGDEGGEARGEVGHGGYVGFEGGAKGGEERRFGPEVRGEEVVVERGGGAGEGVGRGEVDLLAVVFAVGGGFVAEFVVSWRSPVSVEQSLEVSWEWQMARGPKKLGAFFI
jgi:hypothetical protein